jgi:hypothetical protein
MTTLAVDDNLYELACEAARAQGKTVNAFVADVLREALSAPQLQQTTRNGLPVMVVNGSGFTIDPRKVRRSLEEDGF